MWPAFPRVGIDISDETLRLAELIPVRKGYRLGRFAERALPPGAIVGGKLLDPDALVSALRDLRQEFHLNSIRFSLPEEECYVVRLEVPDVPPDELRGAIETQLPKHVPVPVAEVVFDYDVVSPPTPERASTELRVAALPRASVSAYLDAFARAGYTPCVCELEAQSVARAVVPAGNRETLLVVDFGKTRTGLSLVSGGLVWLSSTVKIGGDMLTAAIQKNGKTPQEAEALKREWGLSRAPENREIFSVLVPPLSALKAEIAERLERSEKPSRVLLAGRASNLLGFPEYLSSGLGLDVARANPWVNVLSFEETIPDILASDSLGYATALGLALADVTLT